MKLNSRRAAGGSAQGLDWNEVPARMEARPYLDSFLAGLKKDAYLTLIRRWAAGLESQRVLKTDLFEEAFGEDAFLEELAQEYGRAFGLDTSIAITALAHRRLGPRICCVVADIRRSPFVQESFDLIVSPSTLDHFEQPSDLAVAIREIRSNLSLKGRLIVTLDNRQNLFDPLLRLVIRLGVVPYFIGRSYRIGALVKELRRQRLEVEESTAIVHHPRLAAWVAFAVTRLAGLRWLPPWVERCFLAMQRLEHTRWRYFTGCFVAALAKRQPLPETSPAASAQPDPARRYPTLESPLP